MFYGLMILSGGLVIAADRPARDGRAIEEVVAVQVFLDRANFGPGKIDGHWGDFTKKALERYRRAKGGAVAPAPVPGGPLQDPTAPRPRTSADTASPTGRSREASRPEAAGSERVSSAADRDRDAEGGLRTKRTNPESERIEPRRAESAAKVDLSDLDLKSVDPVFIDYTVTDADAQAIGDLPEKPADKARLKWLPYGSVAEAVAERFHMDVDFLEELNRGKTKNLRAGDVVRVPNVEPFDLSSVKDLKPGTALSAKAINAEEPSTGSDDGASAPEGKDRAAAARKNKKEEDSDGKKPESANPSPFSVVISKDENMLEVFDAGRMVAAFPVTVGSSETASPIGEWKVRGVAKLPEFRWDEKMLKEGERGSEFHLLPPGPNSPVGVIWIALNKKGVGIHGSDSPDAIGRNVSHGCIRLANWDVVKLAQMVKTGVPVTIQ
jgi:lipoprotein-anchoring transpeptidase ErfK/SrfK